MRVFWSVLPAGNMSDIKLFLTKLEILSSPRRLSGIELRMGIRFELSYAIFVIRFDQIRATKIYTSITG